MSSKQRALFSEKAADLQVIASLERQIRKLKGDHQMSKIIKSTDGQYYLVHDYEQIDENQVKGYLAELQLELASLEAIAPTEEVVAVEVPAEPEQPVVPAEVVPAQPELPVEQVAVAEPVAPTVDPAALPTDQVAVPAPLVVAAETVTLQ